MKICFTMRSGLNKTIPWLWAATWFTLPLSMKANGLSLIVLGLALVIQAIYQKPFYERKQLILIFLFALLFAWHALSLFVDPEEYAVWKSLERKISLVAIPVTMLLVAGARCDVEKWAVRGFFAGLALTGIHLTAVAIFRIAMGENFSTFTYHEFTKPYSLGAIYYSWYVSAALFYLAFRKPEKIFERFKVALIIFFTVLLLFSASKLFIALTVPAVIWSFIKKYVDKRSIKRLMIASIVFVMILAGSVPFLYRLSELKNTDLKVIQQDEFKYDTPLNGITFRLLLWRFAGEIMVDENAWLTGVGIGSRQETLNDYYKNYGVYTGNPDLGDKGYLDYNFHNQYLEVMTGTGLPGLILLLLIILSIFIVEKHRLIFPFAVYLIVMVFFMTESVLERQAGIVFFSMIWTLRVNSPASNNQ